MKKNAKFIENTIHGVFLVLGLITVASVLLISVYLVISGIPAIGKIGLADFLFGEKWAPTENPAVFGILPFILTSIYGTAGAFSLVHPLAFLRRCTCPRWHIQRSKAWSALR